VINQRALAKLFVHLLGSRMKLEVDCEALRRKELIYRHWVSIVNTWRFVPDSWKARALVTPTTRSRRACSDTCTSAHLPYSRKSEMMIRFAVLSGHCACFFFFFFLEDPLLQVIFFFCLRKKNHDHIDCWQIQKLRNLRFLAFFRLCSTSETEVGQWGCQAILV